ncbi:hypothetical protein Cgig2_001601 [Carnegiea gigantea]|uniref:VQ domain-containing protein n=1 Tax=Carnegiea gigantea TaxID=171969 RepID=A0A9Q1QG30_9CARY|nr:hypothetical protein Cgig2_001601 [Carnegiea gigantea]
MNPQGFMTQNQHQPIHREFTSTIQGPRPSPLHINKTSSSCSSHYSDNKNKKNKPVIIYARSPRVFHTSPQDFMALVQSLTGRDRSPTSDKPSKIDGVAHANARTKNVNTSSSRLVSPKMIFFSPRKIMSMSDIPLYTPTDRDSLIIILTYVLDTIFSNEQI